MPERESKPNDSLRRMPVSREIEKMTRYASDSVSYASMNRSYGQELLRERISLRYVELSERTHAPIGHLLLDKI